RGNYPVLSFYDEAGDANDWFPSVVAESGGELRFGFEALAAAANDPSFTVVRSFKRLLADAHAGPGKTVRIGATTIAIDQLTTAGANHLGGDDFDDVLADLVLARAGLARTSIDHASLERLVDQCRDAKERLNPSSRKISIDVETSLGSASKTSEVVVPVADF